MNKYDYYMNAKKHCMCLDITFSGYYEYITVELDTYEELMSFLDEYIKDEIVYYNLHPSKRNKYFFSPVRVNCVSYKRFFRIKKYNYHKTLHV